MALNSIYRYVCKAAAVAGLVLISGCSTPSKESAEPAGRLPDLFPPLNSTVLPPNMAPPSFIVREKADRFFVSIESKEGRSIRIAGKSPAISIPEKRWRSLMRRSKGCPIEITVFCRTGKTWQRYETVLDTIAQESIDRYVTFRKIPVCKDWAHMGICQRELGSFKERTVMHNIKNGACFHCHSFRDNDANTMIMQVRSMEYGTPMLLGRIKEGRTDLAAINTKSKFCSGKVGFTAFHPTLDIIAFSLNKYEMLFYSAGVEPRAVFDASGDVALFDMGKNRVSPIPEFSRSDRIETMPEWSHDGTRLYVCSGPQLSEKHYREIQCDLLCVEFDPQAGKWGRVDTILSAEKAGGSILQPRCSPDGRYILVNISEYGGFPVDKAGSRLGLFDLENRSFSIITSASCWTDSWHGWSHNGRWIACSSKWLNGRFSTICFRYVDSTGSVHNPFVLPQKSPHKYESSLISHTMPELSTSRIPFSMRSIQKAMGEYPKKTGEDAATSATANPEDVHEYEEYQ